MKAASPYKLDYQRLERFIEYHLDTTGEMLLNDQEQLLYDRLERCFELKCDRYNDRQICTMLQGQFDVGKTTALSIIKQTEFVFSKRPEYKAEFLKSLLLTWYEEAIIMAFKSKNLDALSRLMGDLWKNIDKQDTGISPDMLGNNNYYMVLNGNYKVNVKEIQQMSIEEKKQLMNEYAANIEEVQFELIANELKGSEEDNIQRATA
jgi:hypothetical protein